MDTKKLRQKILDLAIHGKLVPQDPNDEPASVLLERIRAEKEKLIKEGKIKATKKSKSAGDTYHYPKDVPFEVPEGWVWCSITDVVDKLTDGTHNSPKSYPSGAYMYVTAKNIKRDGLDLSNITYVTEDIHRDIYSRCNPEKGDLLYIKDGATCGISTINNLDEEFSLLSSVALIKPNKNILNTYLNLFLQSEFCYRNVRDSMKGVGITRIILKQMEMWDIPLPPYAEQKRIVETAERLLLIMEDIERGKNELGKNIALTKKRVINLAIHGKLVPQDPNDEPAIELLKRINPGFQPTDNLQYHDYLPNGWYSTTFSEVAEYINGRAFKPEEWEKDGLPIVRIQNLNDVQAGYNYSSQSFEERYLIHQGDLLFAWAASLNAYIWNGKDAWLNQHIFKVIPKACILPKYLYYTLKAKIHDFYHRSHGSGMVHITRNTFLKETILLPPLNEQARIIVAIEDLYSTIDTLIACFTR